MNSIVGRTNFMKQKSIFFYKVISSFTPFVIKVDKEFSIS